jgi:hypothetical protein
MDEEEKLRHYELAEKLLSEQNFAAAVVAGAVASVLGAAGYGIVVALWPFSYGFAAAGIGILVGLAMQFLGRGISTKFAMAASLYTIAGCVLGNLFRVIVGMSMGRGSSPIEVLRSTTFWDLAERSFSYFSPIYLVYWFVAVFAAVFLARRPLSRAERLAIGMFRLRS